ncbi:MAG: AraC family transcriptional regulator [Verrucomicrobium sp.]|nr:AraC family transcriptional regulator [Verrucomicrobium sp.]
MKESLAEALKSLATIDGFGPTALADVRVMYSPTRHDYGPVAYDPSVVIIAQGRKRGRLGGRTFVYDARNYLVLALPLPFECETIGTAKEPLLGLAVRISPPVVAELLLDLETPADAGKLRAVDASRLTPELEDAALRLARALRSPVEARILGPQIVREITYRALRGGQGAALQALASPQGRFGRIARALRRIHADYARPLDVPLLAREAGMSLTSFHTHFKALTAKPPQRYLQAIRLHKAEALLAAGTPVAEAGRQVGYESASQFSREFKRFFGLPPKEIQAGRRAGVTMF